MENHGTSAYYVGRVRALLLLSCCSNCFSLLVCIRGRGESAGVNAHVYTRAGRASSMDKFTFRSYARESGAGTTLFVPRSCVIDSYEELMQQIAIPDS